MSGEFTDIIYRSEAKAISSLSAAVLQSLKKEVDQALLLAKEHRQKLYDAMELRYLERARASLHNSGRDTGTTRFTDGDYTIVAELRKKVLWDQEKLHNLVATIPLVERPQYVTTDYKIYERVYDAWPEAMKVLFMPARTVEIGSTTFSINKGENYDRS